MFESFPKALFWAAAIVCGVAQLLVIRSLVLGRTPASSTTMSGRAREVLWILLPALALVVVLVATWSRVTTATPTGGDGRNAEEKG